MIDAKKQYRKGKVETERDTRQSALSEKGMWVKKYIYILKPLMDENTEGVTVNN
jgi:hypothetical protein